MTWTYSEEYYKKYTRDTWNDSAASYGPVLAALDKFNPELLRHAAPKQGERVLDVATGPGEPAMSIGPLVGPGGSVLGIDLAENMIDLARSNAKARGLKNVEFRVMDAEKLDLPDASFDLVVCRFGLQIVTDPDVCLAEARRVLKPGGRFAATVWGPGERVPALHVIVEPMLRYAEPDETGYLPTPYETGGEGELVAMVRKAGFHVAGEHRVVHDWTFGSPEEYMDAILKGTPIGHSLHEEDPPVQKDVLQRTAENLKRWTAKDGRVALPAEAVVVVGTK